MKAALFLKTKVWIKEVNLDQTIYYCFEGSARRLNQKLGVCQCVMFTAGSEFSLKLRPRDAQMTPQDKTREEEAAGV